MFNLSYWKLITLCVLFYVFACFVASITITLTGGNALPITIKIVGDKDEELSNIDVYRVSINGSARLLTQKRKLDSSQVVISDALANSYYQGIQIKLSTGQANILQSLSIKIGNKTFVFSREKLLSSWKQISQGDRSKTYQSPDFVSNSRSILPFWRKVINWDFSSRLFLDIFLRKLTLLVLIITFLAFLTNTGQKIASKIHLIIAKNVKYRLFISITLATLMTIYRAPCFIWPIDAGLDPSWIVGLNWSYSEGLQWGQNIVFTYGPYYWLLYPNLILSQPLLVVALVITSLVCALSLTVFVYYLFGLVQQNKLSVPLAIFALLTLALLDYALFDIVVVAVALLITLGGQKSRPFPIIIACILLALVSLCKFSYLAISLCMIMLYSGQCIVKKTYTNILICCATFIGSISILWVLSGQYIDNLWPFINRAYQVAQGYSEAMSTPIWNDGQTIVGNIMTNMMLFIIGLILLSGIVILFFASLRQNGLWFNLLITSPILFLALKEGFIRMDLPHAVLFFAQFQIIIVAYLILYSSEKRMPNYARTILLGSFISLLSVTDAYIPHGYTQELGAIFDAKKREKLLADSKLYLQDRYNLEEKVNKRLRKASLDIIPYDISLLYGYGFIWNPRPVFQSYSAYTKILDSLNAKHFVGDNMPDKILFSFKSIDNRYPLYDEPTTVRTIINQYDVVSDSSDTYILLEKRRRQSIVRYGPKDVSRYYLVNSQIKIPAQKGYYTYLKADVELTFLGKVLNFLFKIQPLFIDLDLKGNSQPQRFRLIRQTAQDGLLVSTIAENSHMVSEIISGKAIPNATSIKFIGNTLLYKPEIKTTFQFEAYSK